MTSTELLPPEGGSHGIATAEGGSHGTATPESGSPGIAAHASSHSVWSTLREAIRGSHLDYTEAPIGRAVVLLAVPMVLEMLMESVFLVVDVFFVGKLGADAITTVGVTESMMTILYAAAIGLSIGATATVARRIGEKDPDAAAHAGAQAILLGVVFGAIVGVIGAIFAPQLLAAMGASDDVVRTGSTFARVMLGASVNVVLLFLINAVFRGAGDAVNDACARREPTIRPPTARTRDHPPSALRLRPRWS